MSEQKPKTEGKKSSKKLIIIVAAVVLLLGAAGAGYYFFMHKAEPAANDKGGHEVSDNKKSEKKSEGEHEAKSESDSEGEGGEGVKESVYFDLSQPMIVNFPKGSGASLVQMSLSFLADDEISAAALKKHEPMVRNNLMMKINAQNPEALKTKAGKDALRLIILEELNSILDKMAQGKHIKEVFFTTFVMQ